MTNRDVRSRSLEGPFNHHLYIGFSPANLKSIKDLNMKLANHGVICCYRATKNYIDESIEEGVNTSQKCLLFLTSEYLEDEQYDKETSAVIAKSKRFSRDTVIILKSEDLEVIPEKLREFTTYPFRPDSLDDKFVDMITREPIVKLSNLAKQNSGTESAFNYFYGYLHIVLPDFKKRLLEETLRNEPELVQKTVQKMLIIMPESCFCATKLDSPNQIEFTEKYVVSVAHRAGNNKRDFKSSLYQLIDHERNEKYYFVGELATPLLTMYEMYSYGICEMTKDDLCARRDAFYVTLKTILSDPNNAECFNQFQILYWSDPKTGKPNRLDLYNFLLPVLRNEIKRQNEKNPSDMGGASEVLSVSTTKPQLNTFEAVPADGCNPARVYEDYLIKRYPMDRRPRGLCRIINIVDFHPSQKHLTHREGADKDEGILRKLFEDYHFLVKVDKNVEAQTLESIFSDIQNASHENYDAFVCCILSHGKLGVIYTSDGKEVEILSLVDLIAGKKCPSLEGKPKMFFIQTCQKSDPEPESGTAGNVRPRDVSTDPTANTESPPLATCEEVDSFQEGICSIQNGTSNITMMEAELEIKEDAIGDPPTASTLDKTPQSVMRKTVLVPESPDFLMSYSTLPGSLSYRSTQTGSFYIQALNECLRKDMDIERALKLVTSTVKKNVRQLRDKDRYQMPFYLTSGMYQSIYL